MTSEVIIDVQPKDISIALLEDKRLVEFQSEKREESNAVGNIYAAKVKKILPALNACFVDVGYEREAFLHYLDLGTQFNSASTYLSAITSGATQKPLEQFKLKSTPDLPKDGQISQVLKAGDEILVQISKEPISTKGPRLTCELSFAGRNLVLIPFGEKVSVSSKIKSDAERARLKQLVYSIKPKNFGVIVRTVAEGKRVAELDSEIAEKEERARIADKENTDSIKSGIANFFGKGKYAAIEQDNAKLKAENERIRKAFPSAVNKEVEKRTNVLAAEKQNAEAERDKALAQNRSLVNERNKAIAQLKSQQADEQQRIERAVRLANTEKDKTISLLQSRLKASRQVLNIIADMLYAASDIFKRAIDAIIHYGTEKYKSIFGNDEAADIKNVMQAYGRTKEQHQAIGDWLCDYADSRQPFDKIKHRQTYKEVADVANGAYDWKIQKNRGQSRI